MRRSPPGPKMTFAPLMGKLNSYSQSVFGREEKVVSLLQRMLTVMQVNQRIIDWDGSPLGGPFSARRALGCPGMKSLFL